MLPPIEKVSPPVKESRLTVLRSMVPLGLLWAEKVDRVVMAPKPVLGTARMGRLRVLGRLAGMLTGSPSAGSLLAR